MKIIAYSFEADVHCPACTQQAAGMTVSHTHPNAIGFSTLDSFGIEYDTVDREGNLIRPVFNIDEHEFTHCGDCREELA